MNQSSESIETVVIVHGTFSNPVGSTGTSWWWPGSPFCSELNRAFEMQGHMARCWGHVDMTKSTPTSFMGVTLAGPGSSSFPFSWTGENLESQRRLAADSLRKYLADLQANSKIQRFHVIAHSHGGNVVTRAIRDMKVEPSKLGATVFLGTPFFGFDDEGKIRNTLRRINWPAAFLCVTLSLLSVSYHGKVLDFLSTNWRLWGLYFGLVIGLAYLLVVYYKGTWSPMRHVLGVNIVFPGDEAIGLLKKCAAVAMNPHILLHELFRDNENMKVGWKEALLSSCSRVKLVGKILEGLVMLSFMFSCRPYRPRFRMFFSSRLRGIRESFLYFRENPIDLELQGEVGLAADILAPSLLAASRFLFLPIDFTFGAIDWLFQIASRFSIWLGVRAAAKTAFGIDILASSFQLRKVADCPKNIRLQILAPEVQTKALVEIRSLDPLRVYVLQGLQSAEILATVNSVKTALQATDLLHAHYYRDEFVIKNMAQLIYSAPSDIRTE